MDQTVDERTPEQAGLQRRTLLKGAAWSVPAVLLVGATPAFAASNAKVKVTKATATQGAGKIVTFVLTVENMNTIPVTINSVTMPTPPGDWVSFGTATISSSPWAAKSTDNTITFVGTEKNNSAAFTTFTITLVDSRGSDFNLSVTLSGSAGSVTVSQS